MFFSIKTPFAPDTLFFHPPLSARGALHRTASLYEATWDNSRESLFSEKNFINLLSENERKHETNYGFLLLRNGKFYRTIHRSSLSLLAFLSSTRLIANKFALTGVREAWMHRDAIYIPRSARRLICAAGPQDASTSVWTYLNLSLGAVQGVARQVGLCDREL